MRVFCALPDYEIPIGKLAEMDMWVVRDFLAALRTAADDVVVFRWALPYPLEGGRWTPALKRRKNTDLTEAVRAAHAANPVDVFFGATDGRIMEADTLRAIRALRIPTVNYHCDDVTAFSLNRRLVNLCDINWTNNRAAIPNYEREGARHFYTPFGGNPEIYRPLDEAKSVAASFVGANIGYREEFLLHAVRAGLEMRVCGRGWPTRPAEVIHRLAVIWLAPRGMALETRVSTTLWHLGHLGRLRQVFAPPVSSQELLRLFNLSRINLSFAGGVGPGMCDFRRAPRSMKLRDMEITMSGGFLLTEHNEEIAGLFDVGREIATFTTKQDLVEKIRYYLARPHEAAAMAAAGRQRALRDYTWQRHVQKVLEAAVVLSRRGGQPA
ncbi:MAG: glycosyltransferase [Verrucomicrobiota bacterium]|nr:glycosyltransferase [Verrucomicrobiota bacterium]